MTLQSDSTPWFHNACNEKLVSSCRFGLAFNTDNTGTQTVGGIDPNYANSLSTVTAQDEWEITGNIIANGKTVSSRASIITDSGTSVVYGPIDTVRTVFADLKIPTYEHVGTNSQTDPSYLFGYTSCANPPNTEFGINLGGTTFNIESIPWNAIDNGNDNCTAVLQGTNAFGSQWLVGQAFFQGKYVDHNIDAGTMGWANLKTDSTASKYSKKWRA